ncbi:MAG TPA: GAF domain-containing protein, partial [Tepidisphaeraceae bacterium]|nr:GAF domain-containing protein [Tepidisphaeraceae bacterium]
MPYDAESSPTIPKAALATLSDRLRPMGICVAAAKPDGSIEYVDSNIDEAFAPLTAVLPNQQSRIAQAVEAETWLDVPGFHALATRVNRRGRVQFIAIVAGRADQSQSVVAAHAAMATDWLQNLGSISDMEQDIDALSGQLADTYEELSLIYHISSNMRVNRRPADFFKQACLEVMQVMSLQGVGIVMDPTQIPDAPPVLFGNVPLTASELNQIGAAVMAAHQKHEIGVIWNNPGTSPIHWTTGRVQRLAAAPLQRQDRLLGCLIAFDKQLGDFDSVDAKLLNSIANECAVYTEN